MKHLRIVKTNNEDENTNENVQLPEKFQKLYKLFHDFFKPILLEKRRKMSAQT